MKITNILRYQNYADVYQITYTPNWLEKLFGKTETKIRYKVLRDKYYESFSGFKEHVILREDGTYMEYNLFNNEVAKAINKHLRKF